ncbi:hypothetical protein E4416_00595 [Stenotrophomonas maltophilia]|nr:hypothetical protein E4418_09505 [Stenotrophomonas maltophilia]TIK75425.1 hypothetical protein E4416_00595 [Stenotrophomonas maltophilia]
MIMLRARPCRGNEQAGKSRARAAAIAEQNRRKRPSGGPCAGYVAFRIMYIMFIAPLPDPGFTSHAPDPLQAPA